MKKTIDFLVKFSDKAALPIFFIVVCLTLFKKDLEAFKFIRYVYYIGLPIASLVTLGMVINIFRKKDE